MVGGMGGLQLWEFIELWQELCSGPSDFQGRWAAFSPSILQMGSPGLEL